MPFEKTIFTSSSIRLWQAGKETLKNWWFWTILAWIWYFQLHHPTLLNGADMSSPPKMSLFRANNSLDFLQSLHISLAKHLFEIKSLAFTVKLCWERHVSFLVDLARLRALKWDTAWASESRGIWLYGSLTLKRVGGILESTHRTFNGLPFCLWWS